jgi:uncharacterized repeat protein (TIGR03803 family)
MKTINHSRTTLRRALLCTTIAVLLFATAAATAQTYTVLHTYQSGGVLSPQLMSQGRDGNLYSTILDDVQVHGRVFKITPAGQFTTLYDFCSLTACADGATPRGGVTLGFDGNFYGTTQGGGIHAVGTAFRVTPTGTLTKLWDFTRLTDAELPTFPPLQGQDGNLYGVSETGTQFINGAFYKISAAGVFKALKAFNFTNGQSPNLPTQGTDGNFYGTTQSGGSNSKGVVYKVTPAGAITVLHNFTGGLTDGCIPAGVLVQGNDGNFYGVTFSCGAHNVGTVFRISSTKAYAVLYNFCSLPGCADGRSPLAGLVLGTDGNFYGTASAGGTKNAGTIYKITPAGVRTTLVNFCDPACNGFGPATPLVLHTDGKFYGNTNGNSLGGSVFYSLNLGFKPLVNLLNWSGKVGKTVEILGQGFTGTTAVLFNGVPGTFTNVSDTYMTATVPAGATTGLVTVNTFTTTMTSNRKFLVTPQIKSFTPTSGIVGASVAITGASLTQTAKVTVGGKAATFTVNSDTQVTITVPPGAKTGKIVITTAGGIATSPATFSVVPSIAGFSPASGPVGTAVVIAGNSFTGATQVKFGGVAATSIQVISDTQVDALVPAGAVTGPIAVTTLGGTGISSTNFTVTP